MKVPLIRNAQIRSASGTAAASISSNPAWPVGVVTSKPRSAANAMTETYEVVVSGGNCEVTPSKSVR